MAKMPLVYNNPRHWQERAAEARHTADLMTDPEARGRMLVIAEQYDEVAARSVKRLKARARGATPLVEC